MNIKVAIGYKFILGFIIVVAVAAFVPNVIDKLDVTEWLKQPLSFLTAIVIGLILGVVFIRKFSKQINAINSAAQKISQGDLSQTPELNNHGGVFTDEANDLAGAIVLMSGNLRALVEHLSQTVENLTQAQESFGNIITEGEVTAREINAGTSSIFDGALSQANHFGNVTSAVQAMSDLADDVGHKVTDSVNASQKVNSMVQRGATTATDAMEKMETIFSGIENTERAANRLKERLGDIPRILDVITHISRQTDLLALNATIEASKAGEHGRGFAMVAEEVRRFADNTNNSVHDVSQIVKELRMEVEHVVQSASEGTSNLKGGRDDIRKIREILVDITHYTADVAEKSTLILGLTNSQKDKAEKTARIIAEVADIAKGNLNTTESVEAAVERHGAVINEAIAASQKLSELSRELKGVVVSFKL